MKTVVVDVRDPELESRLEAERDSMDRQHDPMVVVIDSMRQRLERFDDILRMHGAVSIADSLGQTATINDAPISLSLSSLPSRESTPYKRRSKKRNADDEANLSAAEAKRERKAAKRKKETA